MPVLTRAAIREVTPLAPEVVRLTLDAPELAPLAKPGQFVHIRCGEENLLRRPISVCDAKGESLTLVVQRKGKGTAYLSERRPGDVLDLLGPLGHGFEIGEGRYLLVGGGIGTPPLLYAARSAPQADAVLGFRAGDAVILEEDFRSICGAVVVTTEDGAYGRPGNVTGPLKEMLESGSYAGVLACGPRPMLRAVAEACAAFQVPCQVSLEERMGCGVGACLVCACRTAKDGREEMRRVCKDGPVFRAEEVCW